MLSNVRVMFCVILRIQLPSRRGMHASRKSRRHTTIYKKKKRANGCMGLDNSLLVHPLTYFICATSLTGSSGDLREIEGDDEAVVGIRRK